MTSLRKKHFNLIEIVVAIGVIAIGLAGVVALFPAGANATRNAMAQNYTANLTDQLFHQLEAQLRQNWAPVTNSTDYIADSKPGSSEMADFDVSGACKLGGTACNEGNIHIYYESGTNNGVYKVVAGEDDDGNDVLEPQEADFQAIMAIWKKQVTGPGGSPISYDNAVHLNAEISWPSGIDYINRDTASFDYELFKR